MRHAAALLHLHCSCCCPCCALLAAVAACGARAGWVGPANAKRAPPLRRRGVALAKAGDLAAALPCYEQALQVGWEMGGRCGSTRKPACLDSAGCRRYAAALLTGARIPKHANTAAAGRRQRRRTGGARRGARQPKRVAAGLGCVQAGQAPCCCCPVVQPVPAACAAADGQPAAVAAADTIGPLIPALQTTWRRHWSWRRSTPTPSST